jgi:hypothetical protein
MEPVVLATGIAAPGYNKAQTHAYFSNLQCDAHTAAGS